MGQVPVKVFGKVNIGDYIIPSGKNDGIGMAISPLQLSTEHIEKIVGIAWSASVNVFGFNMVNVVVGLNTNDNNPIIQKLEKQNPKLLSNLLSWYVKNVAIRPKLNFQIMILLKFNLVLPL